MHRTSWPAWPEGFHDIHRAAYGYDLPDQPIQSVYLGATAFVAAPTRGRPAVRGRVERAGQRRAATRARWRPASGPMRRSCKRADLPTGYRLPGPAIIEEPDSTTYVPPGFDARGAIPTSCLVLQATGRGAVMDARDTASGDASTGSG